MNDTPAQRFQVSRSDLRALLKPEEAARWDATVKAVRAELSIGRHRASSDAKVLQVALGRVSGGTL